MQSTTTAKSEIVTVTRCGEFCQRCHANLRSGARVARYRRKLYCIKCDPNREVTLDGTDDE